MRIVNKTMRLVLVFTLLLMTSSCSTSRYRGEEIVIESDKTDYTKHEIKYDSEITPELPELNIKVMETPFHPSKIKKTYVKTSRPWVTHLILLSLV